MSEISGPYGQPQPHYTSKEMVKTQAAPTPSSSLTDQAQAMNIEYKQYLDAVIANYQKSPTAANAKRILSALQDMETDIFGDAGLIHKLQAASMKPNDYQNLNKAISETYSLGYQITLAQQKISDSTDKGALPALNDLNAILGDEDSPTAGTVWGDFNVVCQNLKETGKVINMDGYPDPDYSTITGSDPLTKAQSAIQNVQNALNTFHSDGKVRPLLLALETAQGYFGYSKITVGASSYPGFIAALEQQNAKTPSTALKQAIEQAYSTQSRIADAELLLRTKPYDFSTLDTKVKYIIDDMNKITKLLS